MDTTFSDLEYTSFPDYYFLLPLWQFAFKRESDNWMIFHRFLTLFL